MAEAFKKTKVKKHKQHMIGFKQIKMITKMKYMMEKALGMKLSGDEISEKLVEKSNFNKLYQLTR